MACIDVTGLGGFTPLRSQADRASIMAIATANVLILITALLYTCSRPFSLTYRINHSSRESFRAESPSPPTLSSRTAQAGTGRCRTGRRQILLIQRGDHVGLGQHARQLAIGVQHGDLVQAIGHARHQLQQRRIHLR